MDVEAVAVLLVEIVEVVQVALVILVLGARLLVSAVEVALAAAASQSYDR